MALFYVPAGNCGKNFSHLHPDSMKGGLRLNPKPILWPPKDIFPQTACVVTRVTRRLLLKGSWAFQPIRRISCP